MNFNKGRRCSVIRIAALLAYVTFSLFLKAAEVQAGSAFSFVVVGDTRTEPFLPGGQEQDEAMKNILKKRYNNKPVSLFFDPTQLELMRAEIVDHDSKLILHYKNGWPHIIVKVSKGKSRVIMRDSGRKWVFDRIVSSVNRGATNPANGALFIIHGGDIPVFGYQEPATLQERTTLDESPYWQLFDKEFLSRLPPPDKDLDLPGRVLAAVGNHETWLDKEISGLLTTMPWLKELGLSAQERIYSVIFQNCRFIFLDSGETPSGSERTEWTSECPAFKAQVEFLTEQLEAAKKTGANHVFVVYHKPSFVKVGYDPLPIDQNPHSFIKKFAYDFNIFVFNSHAHTTELYRVDGVNYLVLGGGGAPQAYEPIKRSPEKELYWGDESRVEEYNYLQVEVDGAKIKGIIHRFRPTDTKNPLSTKKVFCQ
jgi:hypothetical protein